MSEGLLISLYNIKKFWITYDDNNHGLIVFEYLNGTREKAKFDTLAQAKDCMLNIQGRLDRKFFDLHSNK